MLRLTIKCNITYASQLKVKSWRSAGKHHKKCHLHVCADTSRFLRLAIFIQRRFRPKKKKKWTGRSPRRDCLGYRDRIIVGPVDFTATLIPSGWKTDGCKSHNYCIVWKIRRFYPLHPPLDPIAWHIDCIDWCSYPLQDECYFFLFYLLKFISFYSKTQKLLVCFVYKISLISCYN